MFAACLFGVCFVLSNLTERLDIVQNEEYGQNEIVLHDPYSDALCSLT